MVVRTYRKSPKFGHLFNFNHFFPPEIYFFKTCFIVQESCMALSTIGLNYHTWWIYATSIYFFFKPLWPNLGAHPLTSVSTYIFSCKTEIWGFTYKFDQLWSFKKGFYIQALPENIFYVTQRAKKQIKKLKS